MQTKHTQLSPGIANQDRIVLTNDTTPRTEHKRVPYTPQATEELAHMRGWIAGVALITVLRVRCMDREAGNKYRPFRHTGTAITYRTHKGDERTFSMNTFGLDASVQGVRLEWWHHRLFIAHLLEHKFPCTRCHGESRNPDGSLSLDLRSGAGCNRCWGRHTDPVVLDLICAGGDPTQVEFVHPVVAE